MSRHVELLRRARQDGDLFERPPVVDGPAANTSPHPGPRLGWFGPTSNDYWQQLVQELFVRRDTAGRGAVGVASATAGEGTSFVAAHLAAELARTLEQPTLLLEANVFRPSQAGRHGVEPDPGLRRLLAEREFPLDQALRQTGIEGLWLLPGGASGFYGAAPDWTCFPRLLARLRERFTALVIDLPPVNLSTDAMLLGAWLEALVLVVEADLCSREVVHSAEERLRRANPNFVGTVMNKRKFVIPEAIYRRI
jgi:Mrp family chromosome partitioning ATPase